MPSLVSGGGGGFSSDTPTLIRNWDPKIEELLIGDKFYGIKYFQSNGRLVIQEIDDNTVPIQIPTYRVGDSRISTGDSVYQGSETLSSAIESLPRGAVLDVNNEDVYKNWFTTFTRVTFSWYTEGGAQNAGHLLLELE